MRLWTIQREGAWKVLRERGYLTARRRFAFADFLPAYDWLAGQMRDKLPATHPSRSSVPLWAWYQYESVAKPRPDLRSSGYLPAGTPGWRIEFEIPDELVLLSDFELWHLVLNYSYLPSSEADDERFDREHPHLRTWWSEPPDDPAIDAEIRGSWQRIFDLDWSDPYVAGPRDTKSIQATFWRLEMAWVRRVDSFVAR